MKWGNICAITVIIILIVFYEWPRLNKKQKKEKLTVVVLLSIGWLLGVLIVLFPGMPGPSQLIETIFKPITKAFTK